MMSHSIFILFKILHWIRFWNPICKFFLKITKKPKKQKSFFFFTQIRPNQIPKRIKIWYSYSKASNYPEKMVEEKKLFRKKICAQKYPKNPLFSQKSQDLKVRKIWIIQKAQLEHGTFMPEKELRKKNILRPVERGQTPFLRKSRKKPKNGVWAAVEGSNFVFIKNKVCQAS
jgi:hypothetical protein